ncbi:MAG: hypothetical protein ACRD2X_26250, partial [Vicinamibacteraceae bacterium]
MSIVVVVALLGSTFEIAAAQGVTSAQKRGVVKAIAYDTSRPLREMARRSSGAQAAGQSRDLPPRDNRRVRERYQQQNRIRATRPDPLLQTVAPQAIAPDPTVNFKGPSADHRHDAPDVNGDVGPEHWIS